MESINSNSYWNNRFKIDWESNKGPEQSRFFSKITIENLPGWLIEQIKRNKLTFADWGCAQGDGTDVWNSFIDSSQITGIDFSSTAIKQAITRYPTIRFLNQDWLGKDKILDESYDILFSSNTLEHFSKPYDALSTISKHAKKALILTLPYKELERIDEHFFSFFPNNIPILLDNGFCLIWSRVIDCSASSGSYWAGGQIVLVYVNTNWITNLSLSLSDAHIESFDIDLNIKQSNELIAHQTEKITLTESMIFDRDKQISSLTEVIIDHRRQIDKLNQNYAIQITELNQALAKSDEKILNLQELDSKSKELELEFQNYKNDKEIYIAQLLLEQEKRNQGLSGVIWKTTLRLKRIPYYLSRSRQLLSNGGLRTLGNAINLKLKKKNTYSQYNNFDPTKPGNALNANTFEEIRRFPALLKDELVILSGVPFDDIGGGQRSAQLARSALRTGRSVIYLYVYPKFDLGSNQYIESNLNIFHLIHHSIDKLTPSALLSCISSQATLLIELPHPKLIPYLRAAKSRGVRTVFELIDDWETSLGSNWFSLDHYREFVSAADVVIGTAKVLFERLVNMGRSDALYLPNAANEYIFDKYKIYPRPKDFPTQGKTLIYFGSLYGEWFAWDYLTVTAELNPNLNIILIGDSPAGKILPKNIFLLGSKKIDELPRYLAYSDIGMIPFLPGQISDAVSPIKVFEYIFAGKPVVATRLPEIVDYPNVFIADSPDEFANLCKKLLVNDLTIQQNEKFISKNSWFYRLDQIMSRMDTGQKSKNISAIILIHNNKNIINRCLETLIFHGTPFLQEIIVVDNNSSDGGAEYIQANYQNVIVIRNRVNGCSSGRNLGARKAKGKYLAFFDSDQWFTSSSFIHEALSILENNADAGAVGWTAGWFEQSHDNLAGVIADYCPNRAMNDFAVTNGFRSDIGYLGTGGFFIPRSVFEATNGFDTFYDPTCFEDTDISFQIKKLGLKICYRDLTGIRHEPHQTTKANSQSINYIKLFQRNAEYFKKKWDQYPDFFLTYPD